MLAWFASGDEPIAFDPHRTSSIAPLDVTPLAETDANVFVDSADEAFLISLGLGDTSRPMSISIDLAGVRSREGRRVRSRVDLLLQAGRRDLQNEASSRAASASTDGRARSKNLRASRSVSPWDTCPDLRRLRTSLLTCVRPRRTIDHS